MIDFHTHILPGLDDGSRNIEQSLHMFQMESCQGVHRIVATPHFYAHQDSVSRFLKRRGESWDRLSAELEPVESQMFALGAEVYYFSGMGQAEQLPQLCVEGSSFLLVELPFAQWTEQIYKDIRTIWEKQKLTVVLAHVERYYEFQKKKEIWNRIFSLPLYAQINTGGMDKRRKRRFVSMFLDMDVPVVLGSDCHNDDRRPPNMQQGRDWLCGRFGVDILQSIDAAGKRLLG